MQFTLTKSLGIDAFTARQLISGKYVKEKDKRRKE